MNNEKIEIRRCVVAWFSNQQTEMQKIHPCFSGCEKDG